MEYQVDLKIELIWMNQIIIF